jgi:hypothetical protein
MGPLAALLGAALAATPSPVRAWEGTETIVTYEEGAPDVNPPFDLFAAGRFNYPYTMRLALTDRKAPRAWRTLNLENEHLRVTVLPDIGGRLWRAVDKANGAQMFYANPSLKFAQVAYRGAWATFGIEFNFPVSHHWMTSSPVDYALVRDPTGAPRSWWGTSTSSTACSGGSRSRCGPAVRCSSRRRRSTTAATRGTASTGGRTRPSAPGTTRSSSIPWSSRPPMGSPRSTAGPSTPRASTSRGRATT